MGQAVNVNFRLDAEDKKNMEQVCTELGLSMSAAFTIFAKKVGREHRIPFDVSVDPFYSESNIKELKRRIESVRSGKSTLEEHALIEVDFSNNYISDISVLRNLPNLKKVKMSGNPIVNAELLSDSVEVVK